MRGLGPLLPSLSTYSAPGTVLGHVLLPPQQSRYPTSQERRITEQLAMCLGRYEALKGRALYFQLLDCRGLGKNKSNDEPSYLPHFLYRSQLQFKKEIIILSHVSSWATTLNSSRSSEAPRGKGHSRYTSLFSPVLLIPALSS